MTSLLPDDDEHLTTGLGTRRRCGRLGSPRVRAGHASWAITQARSLGRPWRDGHEWAGGHSGDRGAMTNWFVLKQPLLDLHRVIGEVDELFPPGVPVLLVSAWPTSDLTLSAQPGRSSPVDVPATVGGDVAVNGSPHAVGVQRDELAEADRLLVDGYPMPELQPFSAGCLYARRCWPRTHGSPWHTLSLIHI